MRTYIRTYVRTYIHVRQSFVFVLKYQAAIYFVYVRMYICTLCVVLSQLAAYAYIRTCGTYVCMYFCFMQ